MPRSMLCVMVAIGAVASWDACAQPPAQPPDATDPYRISLRNVAPFTPDAGVGLESLPTRDENERNVHVIVQLDVTELDRARDQQSQETLRRLFSADPAANPDLLLQQNIQGPTYEALISGGLAADLIRLRSLAPLDNDAERFVRWIGPVPPEAKLEPGLQQGLYQRWGVGPNNTLRLLVTFHEDAIDRAQEFLDDLAVEHERYAHDTWRVLLRRSRLDDLVAEDSVRSAAQGPRPFTPLNSAVRTATGVETVQDMTSSADPPTYAGLTGQGIAVAVMESEGIDADHDDFWEHDPFEHRTISRIQHHTGRPPTTLHGTHIAGIIAGNGYQSTRRNANTVLNGGAAYQWRGMAPRATILSFEDVASGGDAQTQYDATVIAGADVSNDSHVQQGCLIYDDVAENVDALIRGDLKFDGTAIPPRAAVWAAGNNGDSEGDGCPNSGYFGLTVASKNVIVVGAVNVDRSNHSRSSLGPTYDGRLKPDVVAPGCITDGSAGIQASATTDWDAEPLPGVANGYHRACGTSVAAAVVTGTIALLLEKWREEFGTVTGCLFTSGGECFPLPSTLKAVLIHGATDIADDLTQDTIEMDGAPVQALPGPDYATGYGFINAVASVAIIDAGAGLGRRIVESEISATSGPDEYFFAVPPGADRLRVTLAWDDARGNHYLAPTAKQLKNDLDLEVISPSNVTSFPWRLPLLSPKFDTMGKVEPDDLAMKVTAATPGTDDDDLNNVEQVELDPGSGSADDPWIIRVKGDKLGAGVSQRYSLVSDFAIGSGTTTTPLPPTSLCVDMDWTALRSGGARVFQFDFPPRASCGSLPLDPICRYVLGCPGCAIFGLCADLRMRLVSLPEFFRVTIRRRDGSVVASEQRVDGAKVLAWQPVAGEKYGLYFEAGAGAQPRGAHTVEATLEASR